MVALATPEKAWRTIHDTHPVECSAQHAATAGALIESRPFFACKRCGSEWSNRDVALAHARVQDCKPR